MNIITRQQPQEKNKGKKTKKKEWNWKIFRDKKIKLDYQNVILQKRRKLKNRNSNKLLLKPKLRNSNNQLMDQLKNLEENLKMLNQAFQMQCQEDFDGSWDQLQQVWQSLEPLIQLVDKQPQIQQVLGQNREILPNVVLQNVGTTSNDIMIAKPPDFQKQKVIKKTKNFWTQDELKKLEEALQIYKKKDFKNISNYIGTRTIAQVRSKMQKLDKKNYNQFNEKRFSNF